MKKILLLMFTLSTLFGCNSQTNINIQKLDVIAYKEAINAKNVQLIDVRKLNEYLQGHIKNARLIDFLANDFKERMQQLDKEKPVYLYCRSGNRSGKASKLLNELGFTEIHDLKGGYMAWTKQN